MRHARTGGILIQVAVIIAIGVVLGVADAVIRPINLKPRTAPPPLPPMNVEPASGATPAAGTSEAAPSDEAASPASEQPPVQPATQPAQTAAPAAAPAAAASTGFTPTPKDKLPVGHITIDEAFALYQRGQTDMNTYFIDSRKMEDYVKGHVPGAIRIDTAMFQLKEPDELGLIPRTGYVVVYCNGGHCDESENVAKRLDGSGYKFVYVLHDGLPGWKALGHPVQVGE